MITLIYPPATLPTSPYSSLPYLQGGLERLGFVVRCIDLNVEAYDFWLSSQYDSNACALFQIEDAKGFLRNTEGEIIDIEQYKLARDNITSYFSNIKKLSFGGYVYPNFRFSISNLKELSEDKTDPISTFYHYYFSLNTIEDNYTGISVTYDFQLLPSLLLAYTIKKKQPNKKILLGGAAVHYLKSFFAQNRWIFDLVDLIVLGDGILPIANYISGKNQYPDSLYLDDKGDIKHSEDTSVIDFQDKIVFNYSGLPFKKYFTPTLTGIVLTSVGCYYGKCAFCVPSKGINHRYHKLPVSNIIDNIKKIKSDLNSDIIFFGDDCLDIKYHTKLLLSLQDSIFWQAEFRFEQNLTESVLSLYKEKGCLQLLFGLESISQRVLDLMKKGTKTDLICRILCDCYQTSIRTNMQTIVGFPTETIEEAYSTVKFLYDNKEKINSCAVSPFCLYQGSDVYCKPDKYKIKITQDDNVCKYSSSESIYEREKEMLSTAFFDSISEFIPYNTFFLDGPMGNHASIYYKHNIKL